MSAILAHNDPADHGPGPGRSRQWFTGRIPPHRRWLLLSKVLLLPRTREPPDEILPALSLLEHTGRIAPASSDAVLDAPVAAAGTAQAQAPEAVLVDARR